MCVGPRRLRPSLQPQVLEHNTHRLRHEASAVGAFFAALDVSAAANVRLRRDVHSKHNTIASATAAADVRLQRDMHTKCGTIIAATTAAHVRLRCGMHSKCGTITAATAVAN
eukprot:657510-Pelagomonas_calceolata.AAC.1